MEIIDEYFAPSPLRNWRNRSHRLPGRTRRRLGSRLGHRRLESTQWYAAITPDKLTQAYVDARYFERNVAVVQVLLDRAAIESGAAGRGEAYKYVHLGHGCAVTFTCRGTQPELRLSKQMLTINASWSRSL